MSKKMNDAIFWAVIGIVVALSALTGLEQRLDGGLTIFLSGR